jgi:hypothetical protein
MGKGSRRAYNKGIGLKGDQGNEMAEIFFLTLPLHLHPGPGVGVESSGTVPSRDVPYPWGPLRYASWRHGVAPFAQAQTDSKLPPQLLYSQFGRVPPERFHFRAGSWTASAD